MRGAIVVIDVIEDQPVVLKPQFLLSCKPDSTVLAGQCMYAAMIKVMAQTFPDLNQSVHFVIDCLIDCMEAYPFLSAALRLSNVVTPRHPWVSQQCESVARLKILQVKLTCVLGAITH